MRTRGIPRGARGVHERPRQLDHPFGRSWVSSDCVEARHENGPVRVAPEPRSKSAREKMAQTTAGVQGVSRFFSRPRSGVSRDGPSALNPSRSTSGRTSRKRRRRSGGRLISVVPAARDPAPNRVKHVAPSVELAPPRDRRRAPLLGAEPLLNGGRRFPASRAICGLPQYFAAVAAGFGPVTVPDFHRVRTCHFAPLSPELEFFPLCPLRPAPDAARSCRPDSSTDARALRDRA